MLGSHDTASGRIWPKFEHEGSSVRREWGRALESVLDCRMQVRVRIIVGRFGALRARGRQSSNGGERAGRKRRGGRRRLEYIVRKKADSSLAYFGDFRKL